MPIEDSEFREAVRARSKAVLGNKDRAEVGAAIGLSPDGLVNATDLARELDLPNSRVRAQLLAFVEGGCLEPVPSLSEKKNYQRRSSQLWAACADLIQSTPFPSGDKTSTPESSEAE